MQSFCLTVLLVVSALTSCDRPECKTTKPVFISSSPRAEPYKAELAAILSKSDPKDYSYWIDQFEVDSQGRKFLWVYIQGNGLCAQAPFLIPSDASPRMLSRFSRLRPGSHHGLGYSGAELVTPRFDILPYSSDTRFIYRSDEGIID
jgi:hypothetical protein